MLGLRRRAEPSDTEHRDTDDAARLCAARHGLRQLHHQGIEDYREREGSEMWWIAVATAWLFAAIWIWALMTVAARSDRQAERIFKMLNERGPRR